MNIRISKTFLMTLLVLLLLVIPLLASADTSGSCGSDMTWVLDDEGTLTISGTGEMTSHPWGTSVKKVVIEPGVTSVCDAAFANCTSLESAELPESVTSIGNQVFYK